MKEIAAEYLITVYQDYSIDVRRLSEEEVREKTKGKLDISSRVKQILILLDFVKKDLNGKPVNEVGVLGFKKVVSHAIQLTKDKVGVSSVTTINDKITRKSGLTMDGFVECLYSFLLERPESFETHLFWEKVFSGCSETDQKAAANFIRGELFSD